MSLDEAKRLLAEGAKELRKQQRPATILDRDGQILSKGSGVLRENQTAIFHPMPINTWGNFPQDKAHQLVLDGTTHSIRSLEKHDGQESGSNLFHFHIRIG
jgi:hypothetical protein